MKNRYKILAFLFLLLFLVNSGCDDNNPIVSEDSLTTFAVGRVTLRPYVDFSVSIYEAYPDSSLVLGAIFSDSLCNIGIYSHHSVYGSDFYSIATYFNTSDSERFFSGDTANIELFSASDTFAVPLKLLRHPDDSVITINPLNNESLDTSTDFEVTWNSIPNADWYGFEIWFRYDSSGQTVSDDYYMSTQDTSITIPGNQHGVDGRYTFWIIGVTGPLPGTGVANLAYDNIRGFLYSCTYTTYLYVNIGNGLPKGRIDMKSPIISDYPFAPISFEKK